MKNLNKLQTKPLKVRDAKESAKEKRKDERDFLIGEADTRAETDRKQKEVRDREIEFVSGSTKTINQIQAFLVSEANPYQPYFPYSDPFWRNCHRMLGLPYKDGEYKKPKAVMKLFLVLTYNRFPDSILSKLRKKNIRKADGEWAFKHFQFLDEKGIEYLVKFREEGNQLMENCQNVNELTILLHLRHGIPYQLIMSGTSQSI